MNLYEIDTELKELIEAQYRYAEETEGEVSEELDEQIEAFQMAREDKIRNIACFVKNLRAEATAIKAEKQSLTKRQQTAENKAERLSKYLAAFLEEGEVYSDSRCKVGWRSSSAVVFDEALVPDEFWVTKREVSKSALKDALKKGHKVPGASIEQRQNLSIK